MREDRSDVSTVLVRKDEMTLGTVHSYEDEDFEGIKGAVGKIQSQKNKKAKT
jgi:hypothetical protein